MAIHETALAFQRFGLGARPGDLAKAFGDVRTAMLAELTARPEPSPFAGLPSSADLLEAYMEFRGERRAARRAAGPAAEAQKPAQAQPPGQPPAMAGEGSARAPAVPPATQSAAAPGGAPTQPSVPAGQAAAAPVQPTMANPVPLALRDEVRARLRTAVSAPIGFAERLALFWANHFTVASVNPRVRIVCGAFEREAIRPHVAGRFADLLLAAESHPAMLIYLDNARSFGPNSVAGQRRGRGLNENLAREILELHTVGVDGGYTQADVTRFAEVLTGWSLVGPGGNGGRPGSFIFRPQMHEPGARQIMGRTYPQSGLEQGRAVLADLARHPSTARHVATRLCRHFIADNPSAGAIERVASAFRRSDGHLPAVYEALLTAPEAWAPARTKLRTPYEYVIALARALAVEPEIPEVVRALSLMGQPIFAAPSPKGWPEEAAAWAGPDAIKTRLDLADMAARRAARARPLELARGLLGPLLSDETETAIRRAESPHQAVALLLMSPEFQRR